MRFMDPQNPSSEIIEEWICSLVWQWIRYKDSRWNVVVRNGAMQFPNCLYLTGWWWWMVGWRWFCYSYFDWGRKAVKLLCFTWALISKTKRRGIDTEIYFPHVSLFTNWMATNMDKYTETTSDQERIGGDLIFQKYFGHNTEGTNSEIMIILLCGFECVSESIGK